MKEKLLEIIDLFEKEKKYDIFLVANASIHTEKMSFYNIKHACSDEFFSLDEFQEITTALFKTGSYINIFYNELEFIQYIIENSNKMKLEELMIYNLARDGISEGKKSLIPSFCDLFSIKYSGSNAFVISLCRNKYSWLSIANSHKISVPKTIYYNMNQFSDNINVLKGKKIIIKNCYESASIGLSENSVIDFKDYNQIKPYLNKKTSILFQEYIEGLECEVPFFNISGEIIVLDPVLIRINNSNIITSTISNNYEYTFDLLKYHLQNEICEKIRECVKHLAIILGIQVYGRIDFRINNDNQYFVIDIAATPYTIQHSSFAFLFEQYGLCYEDIYKIIIYASSKKY